MSKAIYEWTNKYRSPYCPYENKYVFKLSQMKINCSSLIWINKYENKFNGKIAHT